MFLTRIDLSVCAADAPELWREVATPGGAHRALWDLYRRSPGQKRDFLFREVEGPGRGPAGVRFLVLSREKPIGDGNGLWHVDPPKAFSPILRPGDRLGFSLRASPTVRRRSGESTGKRCDVVMDAKKREAPVADSLDPARLVHSVGERWLARQGASSGFEIAQGPVDVVGADGLLKEVKCSTLRVDGYRQHRVHRGTGNPIRFSTMDFEGVLVVRDPGLFIARVAQGMGPQKAFGCGLMLLRRA